MAVTKATTTKRTATTELVLGQAAQQITKAVNELNAATKSVNELATAAEALTLQVANKEEAIAALEVEYNERKRQADVDLELTMKANTERVVTTYLSSTSKVAILSSEWTSLQKELTDVKSNTEKTITTQVAAITETQRAQYENDIRFLQSENKAIAAENASKIGVLTDKNAFLEEQVTKLYLQLDAERAAGIERAKAGSVGSINVAPSSK
jgi:hypothetical protein